MQASASSPLGITFTESGTEIRVWAPNAKSVDLIGEFNGGSPGAGDRLTRDPASGIWSGQRSTRLRGSYGFLINGNLRRRDPYGRAVTPDHRLSFAYDPSVFDWKGAQPLNLAPQDLVIYELHIGAFYDPMPGDGRPGTFSDAIKRLDALVQLGVNCLLVMPIHEFPGMHSWGYNPSDPFAVEQAYGGPDGFKTFVQACHQRGLAVHLDIVHNHYGPDHLDLMNFDGTGKLYFYEGGERAMTPWGPRLNFDDGMVRRYVADNAMMWLREYRVDGFRWDSTINIRACNQGRTPLNTGATMLEEINARIRQEFPDRLSIAEDSLDIGSFHGSWDYDFHHQVVPVLSARRDEDRDLGALVSALSARPAGMFRVVYIDNHDEAGKLNGQFRIASDVHRERPESDYARRLCGLGAVLTLTAPGVPLIFMGNEMQESGTFHEDQILDWGNWKKHEGMVLLHRDLIRLRRNLDGAGGALKGSEIDLQLRGRDQKCLVYTRWDAAHPEARMVIAMNLSSQTVENLSVKFPAGGGWSTVLNTEWSRYGGSHRGAGESPFSLTEDRPLAQVRLTPYSARIFAPMKPARGAPAPAPAAPAPTEPEPDRPLFSFFGDVRLAGDLDQLQPAGVNMKLVEDNQWEFHGTLGPADHPTLAIASEGAVKTRWGLPYVDTIRLPFEGTLKRGGVPLRVDGTMQGHYRVKFNEQSMYCRIEATDQAPPPPEIRVWTNQKGQKVKATLLAVEGDTVTLRRETGQEISVSLETLSEVDRQYIQQSRHLLSR